MNVLHPVVGFVGAGNLGEPMVQRLLAAGHDVHAFARRDEVRDRLDGYGAALTGSVSELAERSDVLISCLFSDAQLTAISSGTDGIAARAKPGAILVSHTTGRPATLAAIRAQGRLEVLDAPVSGTAAHIKKGELTILLGGRPDAVRRVTPILGAYSDKIIGTGELGTGLNIKLVNNLLFAANIQLLDAAVQLANKLGVAESRLLDALLVCSGGSRAAGYARDAGGTEILAAGIGPVLRKDIAAARASASEAEADPGLLLEAIQKGSLGFAHDLP